MSDHGQSINQIINGLPENESRMLLAQCEAVNMDFGDVLCDSNQTLMYAYFPQSGLISLLVTLPDHPSLEISMIGSEGMLGATVALGVNRFPMQAMVKGGGRSLRIKVKELQRQLQKSPYLLRSVESYLYDLIVQMVQSNACTRFHKIEPRLARWLLIMQDSTQLDHFHFTHGFLAEMLGVRRSGITVAAGALQLRNLIHYNRGEITILDRKGLAAVSCECYRLAG